MELSLFVIWKIDERSVVVVTPVPTVLRAGYSGKLYIYIYNIYIYIYSGKLYIYTYNILVEETKAFYTQITKQFDHNFQGTLYLT